MTDLSITWAELKSAWARGFPLYYVAFPQGSTPESYFYTVLGVEHDRFYQARLEASADVADFETNFKDASPPRASAVSGRDAVIALTPPATNSLGAQLVEVTSKLSQRRSLTIVSHDFSEPCTWWQGSTPVTQETLSDEGSGVFGSAHPIWINVEHPKVFADELLDGATWAADGYAGYPNPQESYYLSWWQADATLKLRYFYYPVIQVQPGGTGSWVTAYPDSVAAAPNYAYTIDYMAGKVHFNSQANWPGGTLVRASYFYTEATADRSIFEIGPPAGKIWLFTKTKVQLTSGASWRDSLLFYGREGGVTGLIGKYKSYGEMQSTATKSWTTAGGIATTPHAWPADAENGWIHGGCDGMRNHVRPLENSLWEYDQPFKLVGDLQDRITIHLAKGQSFLDCDEADVSFRFDEYNV